ncbi:phage holin family protein [Nocardioides sp. 1609]|uniref:phage holin family protein n=1 Tax=Nocardioides sp. 1609 TaxID=2508327 RepID=UPI00106F21AB|nr:phage holin family protein [Nocardioides sp. 1609]
MSDPQQSVGQPPQPGQPTSTGELISRLSDQSSQLIRDEIRLAQAETAQKVKHGVSGIAGFGVAGVLALYGVLGLLATAVLGLAEVLPAWLSALIVSVVVLLAAAAAALLGKKEMAEVGGVAPTRAVEGVKQDVETLKGGHHE